MLPEYVLPLKIVKPRLQASLPASVTGVLPRPLGKAPTRLAICTHQWYDECDINDPHLEALYRESKSLLEPGLSPGFWAEPGLHITNQVRWRSISL